MSGIFLSGEFVSSIFADRFFQRKYQRVHIAHGFSSLLSISSCEEIIEGGEVYNLQFLSSDGLDSLDRDQFHVNMQVEECLIFQRAEWYSPISLVNGIIGENPRVLQWSKSDDIPSEVTSYKITTYGYLLKFANLDILIYTSDYPGCIEITMDKADISLFSKDSSITILSTSR